MLLAFVSVFFVSLPVTHAESSKSKEGVVTYKLTVDYKNVFIAGKNKKAMAINNSIPAPTLYFKEGDKAVVYVRNKMDVETSIHWHGILLPNFEDGVPYLTSPPIRPGKMHKFEFVLKQPPGTYWYHSHTGLQEQEGLFGAIVIEPKRKTINYSHDLVVVLSDWTDENPNEVLRSLKRGNEWYSIKKNTLLSLFHVLKKGALGAQLEMWKQRMPGVDISDIYYPAFLVNGKTEQIYPQFKAGDKVRFRVINAAASTYFWLSFGGKKPLLISADGLDVQPVPTNKLLQAIAETYDFLLKIPSGKAIEFKATAQDRSGEATVVIGKGEILKAPLIPQLDIIKAMKDMAESHKGGHYNHGSDRQSENHKMKEQSQPNPHSYHKMKEQRQSNPHSYHKMKEQSQPNQHSHHKMKEQNKPDVHHANKTQHPMHQASNHYDHLKSIKKTQFSKEVPVKEIEMNLTGNMWRYVWSINGKVLSEVDKVRIQRGEITRIVLNNKTMMHHPMHLHGHFFRVLNKNGAYSPLKHTVDVPPMSQVTIEFDANEKGDWFFHCHVLYHMKGGMARVLSYGDKRDSRLKDYPLSHILNTDRHWFKWGEASVMSNRLDLELTMANTRNQIMFEGILSWVDDTYKTHKNFEMKSSYEYFFTDFFRLYGGLDVENKTEGSLGQIQEAEILGQLGLRYLLPYFFHLDFNINHKFSAQLGLSYDLMLFSQLEFFSEWEGIIDLSQLQDFSLKTIEHEWSLGLEYLMSQKFSLISSYDNRFGWGGGIHFKF